MTDSFEARGESFAEANFDADQNSGADFSNTPDFTETPGVLETSLDAVASEPNGFVKLGLAKELLQAVADMGFTQPTAVQMATIPKAMQALDDENADKKAKFTDLLVSSQTGSGKTAAFLLPVLHTLLKQQEEAERFERAEFERLSAEAVARGEAPAKKPKRKDPTNLRNFKAATPGALILCPTRELAQQVCADAIDLVRHCRGLRIANVVGGIPYQLQIAKLQNANLVVATPGRLLDLQRSMQIKLDQVQFLVVDEADRMLDLGFADDLTEVNQLTIERKQTMMFSATFAPRIMQLATRVMRQPQRVEIDSPHEKHASITQSLHWADNMTHKRKLLDHLLRDTTINQASVFACTQVECDGLANDLVQDGFSAVALHGALGQGLRNRRLMAFRDGRVQVLVATDVAARGLDVPTITHVINYGLPMKAEDYVHRIGRTGRAGRNGLAITLGERMDTGMIRRIQQFTTQNIPVAVIEGLEPKTPEPRMFAPRPEGRFGGGGNGGGYKGGPAKRFDKPSFGPRRDEGTAPRPDQGFAPRRDDPFQARNNDPRFGPRQEGGYQPRQDESFTPRSNAQNAGPFDRASAQRPGPAGGYKGARSGPAGGSAKGSGGFKPARPRPGGFSR